MRKMTIYEWIRILVPAIVFAVGVGIFINKHEAVAELTADHDTRIERIEARSAETLRLTTTLKETTDKSLEAANALLDRIHNNELEDAKQHQQIETNSAEIERLRGRQR